MSQMGLLIALLGSSSVSTDEGSRNQKPAAAEPADESAERMAESLSLADLLDLNVTTASKRAERASLAPSNITVITAKQIREWGIRDLKELMTRIAGYSVIYDRDEWVLSARGNVGDNNLRYLIMVDGHRINSLENFGPGLFLDQPNDLSYVKQVEIIRGPGSALWGSEALAGVINLITLDGGDLGASKHRVSVAYGQDNTRRANFQVGKQVSEDVDVILSGTFHESEGRVVEADASTGLPSPFFDPVYCGAAPCEEGGTPNTLPPLGRYETDLDRFDPSFMLYLKATAGDFFVRGMAFQSRNKNRQYESHTLTQTPDGRQLDRRSFYTRDQYYIEGGYNKTLFEDVETVWKVSGETISSKYVPARDEELFIDWTETRFSSSVDVVAPLLAEHLELLAGADYTFTTFGPSTRLRSLDARADTLTPQPGDGLQTLYTEDNNVGGYAILRSDLLDNTLHLTAGGRLDYNDDRGDDAFAFSPRIAAVQEVTDELIVKVAYNTGYLRPANFQRSEFEVVPERMRQLELIGSLQLESITVTATSFVQQLEGVLLITPGDEISGFLNTGDYWSYGAELETVGQFGKHSLWGNASLAFPRGRDFGENVPPDSIRIESDDANAESGRLLNYPTLMVNVGGTVHLPAGFFVSPAFRFRGPMPYRTSPATDSVADATYEDTDPVVFIDVNVGYEPAEWVTLSVFGSNLTDEQGPFPISVWNGTAEHYGRYVEGRVQFRL